MEQNKSSFRSCWQRLESDWRKFKRWRRKDPLTRSLATGAYGLGLFLLIVNFLVCGGILKGILNVDTKKETIEFIAYTTSTIFTPIIVVASLRLCWYWLKFRIIKKIHPWWKKNPLINSLIISICMMELCLVMIILLTCEGGIFAWLLGTGTKKETIELVTFGIGGLLVIIGAISINHHAEAQRKSTDAQVFMLQITMILCATGLLMVIAFIGVIINDTMYEFLRDMLNFENKREILTLIGWIGGGTFTSMCTTYVIYQRAIAQEKNIETQVEKNRLIEKRHIDERFNSATENLGSENTGTRIAALHQFYYLAEDSKDDNLKENILNILCSHLRNITNADPNHKEENTDSPSEECNILLDILFKPSDKSVFGEFKARLWKVNLKGANLSGMNLTGVKISGSDFTGATFSNANLSGIEILDTDLTRADFVHTKLEGAKFLNVDIADAVFALACLTKASFSGANAAGASFDRANMTGAKFSFSNLSRTNFMDANLTDVEFVKGHLNETIFRCANLTNANFTYAFFDRVIFIGANLEHACFREVYMLDKEPGPCTSFNEVSNIEGADFRGAEIDKDQLPIDKGRYIADWTYGKFWDDVEKDLKS